MVASAPNVELERRASGRKRGRGGGVTRMAGTERSEVEAFFADPVPSDEGIGRVMELVRDHGGLEYARSRAEEFGDTAAEALHSLPDSESVRALHDAVVYVIGRRR